MFLVGRSILYVFTPFVAQFNILILPLSPKLNENIEEMTNISYPSKISYIMFICLDISHIANVVY